MLGLLAAAAMAACAPTGAMPPPDEPAAAGIQAGLRWTESVSGAGASLTLLEASGERLLTLACVRDPALMTVTVERFRAIGSEERLSLGFDDEPFIFVADLASPRPVGVEASRPIETGLLDRLVAAREVRAAYGAQMLGPHIPPEPAQAQRFAAACRQIAAR
jgi:hypothetical protein